MIELTDPMPQDARQAVTAAVPASVDAHDLRAFVTGVSEAVTNAIRLGWPPVQVRLWVDTDRVLRTVSDRGPPTRSPGCPPAKGSNPAGSGCG